MDAENIKSVKNTPFRHKNCLEMINAYAVFSLLEDLTNLLQDLVTDTLKYHNIMINIVINSDFTVFYSFGGMKIYLLSVLTCNFASPLTQ